MAERVQPGRVQPGRVRAAHQSLHHVVAKSDWSDDVVLAAVRAHVLPIIAINPCRMPGLKQELAQEAKRQRRVGHRVAEDVRYGERSTAERFNGGLKDNHGGRIVRVRGPIKVICHLMFGVLRFTVPQLLRLVP